MCILLFLLLWKHESQAVRLTEPEMLKRIYEYNLDYEQFCRHSQLANWNMITDLGNEQKEKERV